MTKFFLLIALCFTALGRADAPASRVFCMSSGLTGFNPELVGDALTVQALRPLYDRLVEYRGGQLHPGLAERWTISPDGLQYTFRLRKGVTFHRTAYFSPTRPFNADDVLFSFNRQRLSAHPFFKVGGGQYFSFQRSGLTTLLKQIEKLDEHTVRFTLNEKSERFLSCLSADYGSILSAEYADNLLARGIAAQIDQLPIGTGPYSFIRYDRGQELRYRREKTHFESTERRDESEAMVFVVIPETVARNARLSSGECVAELDPALPENGQRPGTL